MVDAPYLQISFATQPSNVKTQEKRHFRQSVAKKEIRQEVAVFVAKHARRLSDPYFETSSNNVSMSTAQAYYVGSFTGLAFSGFYHPKSAQKVPLTAIEYISLPNSSHGLSSSSLT